MTDAQRTALEDILSVLRMYTNDAYFALSDMTEYLHDLETKSHEYSVGIELDYDATQADIDSALSTDLYIRATIEDVELPQDEEDQP